MFLLCMASLLEFSCSMGLAALATCLMTTKQRCWWENDWAWGKKWYYYLEFTDIHTHKKKMLHFFQNCPFPFFFDDGEDSNNQKHFQPAWSCSWKMQNIRPFHQIFCFETVQELCHNRFFWKSLCSSTSGGNCTLSKNTSSFCTQLWGQLLFCSLQGKSQF